MSQLIEKVKASQQLLKYAIAAGLLAIGLDQVFRTDLLQDWDMYVSPLAASIVPAGTLILLLGIAEVIVAVMMVTRFTKLAAYISAVVLAVISVNLLMLGYIDIAARDILILCAALVLAWLTDGLQKEGVPV